MWQQGAAAAYTSNVSLCSRKDDSSEESSANMKIFIGLKDLHAKLQGLTMLDFPFGYLDDKLWSYFEEEERLVFTFCESELHTAITFITYNQFRIAIYQNLC